MTLNEYLIKQFADATNKKAGEFYTPRSVVRLMVEMLDPQEGETVYDPAAGTGGITLSGTLGVLQKLVAAGHVTVREADGLLAIMISQGYRSPVRSLSELR